MEKLLTWIKDIGPILLSWPTLGLVALVLFRRPLLDLLKQLGNSDRFKAKLGPIELERELRSLTEQGQQAVSGLNRLNELMAESRLLELEITEATFAPVFSPDQRERMKAHIDELRKLTAKK
jgi:hypothetical protein